MNAESILKVLIVAMLLSVVCGVLPAAETGPTPGGKDWMQPALPEKSAFRSTGRNTYFILEPGCRLLLKKPTGPDSLTITVLNETKTVDGVETRVVEERETEGGELIEVSRNYFAIASGSNDLFYFGEDVDLYEHGKITGHEGAWLAGVDGARAGLLIPGKPQPGMKFFQEQAPKVAMDRSEIVSVSEELALPAGKFTHCLKVADDSAIEKGDPETKLYAPGVGLCIDEDFRLVEYGGGKSAR